MTWYNVSLPSIKRHYRAGSIIIVVGGTTVNAGYIESINDRYIELVNGPHKQVVFYTQRLLKWTMIEPPEGLQFRAGDPALPLEVIRDEPPTRATEGEGKQD